MGGISSLFLSAMVVGRQLYWCYSNKSTHDLAWTERHAVYLGRQSLTVLKRVNVCNTAGRYARGRRDGVFFLD